MQKILICNNPEKLEKFFPPPEFNDKIITTFMYSTYNFGV